MRPLAIGIVVLAAASALAQASVIVTGKVCGLIAGSADSSVNMLLKGPDGKTQFVTLAPAWALGQTRLNLRFKDKVTIEGAKSKANGKETLTAYSIKKGRVTVNLRDAAGAQQWTEPAAQTTEQTTDQSNYGYQLTPTNGTSGYPGPPIVYPNYSGGNGNVVIFRPPVSPVFFPWRW